MKILGILLIALLLAVPGCKKTTDSNIPDEPPGDKPASAKAPEPKGETRDGKRQGQWVFFHANGKKAAQGEYQDGFKHDKWVFWYDNGQKTAEGEYAEGRKTGKWIDWDEEGNQVSEKVFVDGVESYR